MNKKGFTLVELIATISIMLLIATFAIPSILSLLSKSSDKLNESVKRQLISAAKTYMKDNNYIDNIDEDIKYCILVDELSEENFIDQDKNKVHGRIEIIKLNDEIKYTYSSKNNLDGCEDFPDVYIDLDEETIDLTSKDDPIYNKNTLLGKMVEKYGYYENTPDFHYNTPTDGNDPSGLYKTYDNNGATYYFRGAITDNYIKFDGSPILFQIMRFNGNGNIRLVSNEPIYQSGTTPKKISYDGIYQEYRKTYELYDSAVEYKFGVNYSTDLDDIIVYKSISLKDKFNSSTLTYVQDPNYPTLDKCFVSGNPCKNKYISVSFSSSYYNSSSGVYYKLSNTGVSLWNNILKINTATYNTYNTCTNGYGTCKYALTTSQRLGSRETGRTALWESNFKNELESWFDQNMYDYEYYYDYIVSDNFCIEEDITIDSDLLEYWSLLLHAGGSYYGQFYNIYSSVFRLDDAKKTISPTYSCCKNCQQYTSHVGTLTADDVVFAGAVANPLFNVLSCCVFYSQKLNNTEFFLFRNGGYHTLTKSFDGRLSQSNSLYNPITDTQFFNNAYNMYQFNGNKSKNVGSLIHSDISSPVYPVINIRGDVKVTGSGTEKDPYVIYE